MTLVESIKTCFSKYATLSGRATRSEFWWWTLFTFIVGLIFGAIPVIGQLLWIAFLLPSIAVGVRRLHDINKSGWWYLISLTGIGVIVLLVFALIDSKGDNEYGPKQA